MKTIKEHLECLSPIHRARAMSNTPSSRMQVEEDDLDDALSGAFDWSGSPEGSEYWNAVCKSLHAGTYDWPGVELPRPELPDSGDRSALDTQEGGGHYK